MGKTLQLKCSHFNTILYCRDFQKTVDFYQNVLGLKINFVKDWFVEFMVTNDGYLSIADASKTNIFPEKCDCVTLSFQVNDVKNNHDYFKRLGMQASKIKPVWNAKSFFIHDPERHRIEFWNK